jgi:4-phosphopantoate--beta-alanine ligase
VRERLAACAKAGIVTLEGLTAHGRGEAFDYLLGERTTESALLAERCAAALIRTSKRPVLSVNGNTAALAAREIRELQQATSIAVEVNLFHRTEERVERIEALLRGAGVEVLTGRAEPLLPLSHARAYCLREGIYAADTILVPLEDGDRCEALVGMGKRVIAVDLNPLSRTSRCATLTIVDELTRALPEIASASRTMGTDEMRHLSSAIDNRRFLRKALAEMNRRLIHALD